MEVDPEEEAKEEPQGSGDVVVVVDGGGHFG